MCRIPRIVIGFALVAYAVTSGNEWFFLGFIPLVTGLINKCPMGKLLGGCSDGKCDTSSISSSCCDTSTNSSCCTTKEEKTKEEKCCVDDDNCCDAVVNTSSSIIKIEILGTGCANCKALYQVALNVTKDMNQEFEIIKVEDLQEIMKYNVVSTPGLVINGEVKSTGKLLNTTAMKELIEEVI